jgi:hypothetical protein
LPWLGLCTNDATQATFELILFVALLLAETQNIFSEFETDI